MLTPPQKPRLDDFDYYVPAANRENFTKFLPRNLWRDGAFIVHHSGLEKHSLGIILIILDKRKDNNHSEGSFLVKQLLIKENSKEQPHNKGKEAFTTIRSSLRQKKIYFLNEPNKSEGKFNSPLELIDYYQKNSLSKHVPNLESKVQLQNVFDVVEYNFSGKGYERITKFIQKGAAVRNKPVKAKSLPSRYHLADTHSTEHPSTKQCSLRKLSCQSQKVTIREKTSAASTSKTKTFIKTAIDRLPDSSFTRRLKNIVGRTEVRDSSGSSGGFMNPMNVGVNITLYAAQLAAKKNAKKEKSESEEKDKNSCHDKEMS